MFLLRIPTQNGGRLMTITQSLQGASRGATVVAHAAAAAAVQAARCSGACAAQHLQTGSAGQLP